MTVIAASAPTAPLRVSAPSSARRRVPAFVWEIAIAVGAYLIYEAARFIAVGSYPTALVHAHQVVALERHLDLNVESTVQNAFLNSPLLPVLNYVYLAAQNLVLPASLVLLYRLNRTTYRTLRNTLLATWLLSLPVYALYPAAPPRLAGLGIVDTVSTGSPLKLEGGTTTSLFNQFAAVPSLHVGFAFAIGIALAAALRNPILRFAALMWGPVMLLTVVATGNHFVFDAITGRGDHRRRLRRPPTHRGRLARTTACRRVRARRVPPDRAAGGAGVATIGDMSLAERLVALEHEGWAPSSQVTVAVLPRASHGGRYYRERLTDDAQMAFPFGVLPREATIEAMESAPPWERYEITDPHVVALSDESGIVVYEVVAQRPGEEPYSAVVSTTFVRDGEAWKVAFHQQSPKA